MGSPEKRQRGWGPEDYWRLGPVYVRKQLALLAVIGLSAAVLGTFGLPFSRSADPEDRLPAYRWNDPELETVSGPVQVLDGAGRARYIGEVDAGAYTGRGQVFDEDGVLVYDGLLADGVYEGQGRRIDPETGIVSEGQFSGGLLEGQGREFDAGGALLREGAFSRDLLEGEGCEYSADGVLLREGTFSRGLLHGEGREYTAGGALRYEGQFRRGIYHGEGTLYDTLLGVRSTAGTFVNGTLSGQGTIYHPSGQLLYTGQVCGDRPRADAFLGLSLAEVEGAFSSHWLLYSCGDVTAFVYPYFKLMFMTESPIDLVSPTRAAAAETENGPSEEPSSTGPVQPPDCEDEVLSEDTDKKAVIITQVLSYRDTLPGLAQPDQDLISGQHRPGWREWFSDFAADEPVEGASVRRSGQFIWRFVPRPGPEAGGCIDEFTAEHAGIETMTARREDKDMSLWYQTAKWRDGP